MRKSKGFTLAEVLITLVIIGVIAAMTIPTMLRHTNDQERKSRFKKAVSAISQALLLDHTLYGTSTAYCDNPDYLARMLRNHMSVVDEWWEGYAHPITADGILYHVNTCDNIDIDTDGGAGSWGEDIWPVYIGDHENVYISDETNDMFGGKIREELYN